MLSPRALLQRLLKPWVIPMPWPFKRLMLQWLFGYDLAPGACIGLAWVYPKQLRMAAGSRIDHFTVAVNLDSLELGENATIGRSNWITGFPTGTASRHFAHQLERRAELKLGAHAAITKNHHFDATNSIKIGSYTTIAGYGSQLLSHSIDLQRNRQHSAPITIGSYCFVGTSCVFLAGTSLPDHSVLAACSLLNKPYLNGWGLFAGQPACRKKDLDPVALYFSRKVGFVN